MSGLDKLLGASVDAVKRSGALEGNALMATVSVVNSGGTVDVTRAGDTYPNVRLLSGYLVPNVGDSVELLRSAGGWVCIGKVMTSSGPRIQTGTAVTPGIADGTWTAVTATFAKPFTSVPTVVVTPISNVTAATTEINWSLNALTASSFEIRCRRSTNSVTTFGYIATDF
jgi:hypothetical protein